MTMQLIPTVISQIKYIYFYMENCSSAQIVLIINPSVPASLVGVGSRNRLICLNRHYIHFILDYQRQKLKFYSQKKTVKWNNGIVQPKVGSFWDARENLRYVSWVYPSPIMSRDFLLVVLHRHRKQPELGLRISTHFAPNMG